MLAAIAALACLAPGWEPARHSAQAATPGGTPAPAQAATPIPDTPVGGQLRWVLAQLAGGAATLGEAEITARFAPTLLERFPAASLLDMLRQTAEEHGPVSLTGFAGTPTATGAIGLIETRTGEPAAVYIQVEAVASHRITGLDFSERPGPPATDIATPGPYTGYFDIGGRRLFLTCAGEGSPTVVLEAGAGGGAAVWARVQPELAEFTRVCSYDRANIPGGASEPAPKPRTAADVVADLHALLGAAHVPGPYVLVGHSFGGLYVRLYAATYPDEVVGLVLVDATHEDQEVRSDALLPPAEQVARQEERRRQAEAPFVEWVGDEQIDAEASFAQMRAAREAAPLRPMPLVVLSHGVGRDPAPGEPPDQVEAMEALWRELQGDLARLVPHGRLVIAERSGHNIQEDQPELVVDAVLEVISAVRESACAGRSRK